MRKIGDHAVSYGTRNLEGCIVYAIIISTYFLQTTVSFELVQVSSVDVMSGSLIF